MIIDAAFPRSSQKPSGESHLTVTAGGIILFSMSHRFHIETIGDSDDVRITGEVVRHVRVRGLTTGDDVILFDGTGIEARARIEQLTRSYVDLRILERTEISREPRIRLTIACAFPKGKRVDTLIRMCAELGTDTIIPLVTDRSVVKPQSGGERSHKLDRLSKIAAAASEQSGRNLIMKIGPPDRFGSMLEKVNEFDLAVILTPGDELPTLYSLLREKMRGTSLLVLVGPEGGFTPREMELAIEREAIPAHLTTSVLRIETACVSAAAVALSTQ